MWIFLIILMFVLSIIVSFKIQFNNYNIKSMFSSIRGEKTSLFMSLGIKIGVGSIVATASSIIIGGYSSVIWMMLFSLITSSLIYYEAYLGKKYRQKYGDDYLSGFFYIINKTYKNSFFSYLSLILLILVYSFLFQMIQSNTISNILNINYGISKYIICICFIILLLIMFKFNVSDIINVMNRIVPIMCVLFICLSLYGIISNIDILFNNIANIELFNFNSILSGMIIGIKRSIFMNETMIGTTSVSSGIDSNDIRKCSIIQVLGSYFISFIITVLICLLLIIYGDFGSIDYNILVSNTYLFTTGKFGLFIFTIVIILFGFTTILSGYYIGKSNICFFNENKKFINIFNLMFFIAIVLSIFVKSDFIWNNLDLLLFVMILINSYSIIKILGSDKYDR